MPEISVKGSDAAAAPKQYSAEDFFIILLSSRAHKFFINTAFILAEVHHDLNKLLMVATSDAPTFEGGRNGCLEMLKETLENNAISHGDSVRALLIDDDGLVRNVTNALAGRSHAFSITVARPKTAGRPQLLALVSSAQPLSALKLAKPVKAAEAFDAALGEAEQNQEQLGVALRYFYVAE